MKIPEFNIRTDLALEEREGLIEAAEDVSVLKMRCSINADTMTKAELHQKLKTGYRDIGKGRVRNASKAFEEWQRKCETSE